MKSPNQVFAACMLLLPLTIAADHASPISPTSPIRELMATLVTPHSDALWAAGSKAYDEPVDPSSSIDDATWSKLESSRLVLADVAQALLLTSRPVDVAGATSPNPEEELSPEQVAALIQSKPDEWADAVGALTEALAQMQQPIADHDLNGLAETGDLLYEACASCHQNFWYPQK